MKTTFAPLKILLFMGCVVFFSCQQEELSTADSVNNTQGETAKKWEIAGKSAKIYVSSVDSLYLAVNNPANAGATIVLAPGTYPLSPNHPNRGRIELLHDMSLIGQAGHPEAVIIDVSALPTASQQLPPDPIAGQFRTGVIRMGNGSNAIEWMTLQNDPSHRIRSIINTDLVTTPVTNIRIAHTIVKGSNIGINIQNRFTESNGRVINAEIVDNELTGNTFLPQGTGIFIQNSWGGIDGGVIRVTLRGNYVHGNLFGLGAFNESSTNSTIEIKSNGDRFEDNALGIDIVGGLAADPDPFGLTNGNSVLFEAYGTAIKNNLGVPAPPGPPYPTGTLGGISAHGGQVDVTSVLGYANNNKIEINLYGCPIENNVGPNQINVWGARSTFLSPLPAGTNNTATVHLYGLSKQAKVNAIASFPVEPAGTNKVDIFPNI